MPSVTRRLLVLVVAVVFTVTACGSNRASVVSSPKLKVKPRVAATAFPLYDAALYISAGRVDVHQVRQIGAFSDAPMTSAEQKELATSNLIISPGRRTQPAFDTLLAQRPNAHLDALESVGRPRAESDEITNRDAYVWLDPVQFAKVVDAIVARFTMLDPAGEQIFEDRAFSYRKRLAALDSRMEHALASCHRRDLVAENGDFAPLANRYGLRLSVTNVVDEQRLAEADSVPLEELRKRGVDVTTVFTDRLPTSRRAAQILDDDDVRVAVLDGLADLNPDARKSGADFDRVMKLNLDALKAALDCRFAAKATSSKK